MNRILLIEDDAGAQLLYRNRLSDLGYQVVVSSTGARGLMEARSTAFDLFLVDIDLGTGIDGYEVCRRLKAIPELHGVPVVLISGHVKAQEDLHRGYEAGCQSFLVKGDLMLLEDVVRAMLRIKTLQDDLALQNRLLEDRNRRFEAEKARSADLEHALTSGRSRQPSRPDGMLLCDSEGVVRASDRGARDLLGQAVEGKHVAQLAPESRLEAFVRNALTEPHESIRFDVPERPGRSTRGLFASVYPFGPQPDPTQPAQRVVLLFDVARQRQGSETWRADEGGERLDQAALIEAAREVFRPSALLGNSPVLCELRKRVAHVALGEAPVLVQGPSGSGKSLVARILHFAGTRTGPFVTLSCAAVPAAELEAELFGVARGAAPEDHERAGAFQRARGGTLHLQDVERLGPALQERLLEALVSARVLRQGASVAERVDVRVFASTRVNLARAVEQGHFLLGLERQLATETITLPALTEHREDIALLAQGLLARHARFEPARFAPEALAALEAHDWSEDVRGLERAVQSAVAGASSAEIRVLDLPAPLAEGVRVPARGAAPAQASPKDKLAGLAQELDALQSSLGSTVSLLDAYEKGALLHALSLTQGDKLAAARVLKIGKSTFYRKLKQHDIR